MAVVHVPPSEATEEAKLLLRAAERLGLAASVVATSSDGLFGFSFVVPDEVFDMSGQLRIEDHVRAQVENADDPQAPPEPVKRKPGRPKKTAAPEPEE